jgi:hypothetical protein
MSTELEQYEIEQVNDYFENGFEFGDWTSIIEKHTSQMATEIQLNTSLIDYLQSPEAIFIDADLRASSIATALSNIESIKSSYDSLGGVITNFKSFGYGVDDASISSITAMQYQANELLRNFTSLQAHVDAIVGMISSPLLQVSNIANLMKLKINTISDLVAEISSINIMNAFDVLPTEIGNKLLQTDYIVDAFTAPKRIANMVGNISSTIPAITVDTNMNAIRTVFKQMSTVLNTAASADGLLSTATRAMNTFVDNVKRGNYYGVISKSSGALRFIERPTEYAAQYPFNQAHTTSSGHLIEIDDTDGAERLQIKHKIGSGVEVLPDGAIIAKSKNDMQIIIDRNGEIYIKGNCNITVNGNTSLYGKGVIAIDSDTSVSVTAPEALVMTEGPTTVSAIDVNILSSGVTTLSSGQSTCVASRGPVTIASDTSILLDAPSIDIGKGRTKSLKLLSIGSISSLSTGDTSIKSGSLIDGKAPLIKLN